MQYLFGILMFTTSVFLILLVLIQRGRGGGLAGAFGGMGGQSAFGTKAGDLFTRITMFVAAFWILLCVGSIAMLNSSRSIFGASGSSVFDQSGGGEGENQKKATPSLSGVGTEDQSDDQAAAGQSDGGGLSPTGDDANADEK